MASNLIAMASNLVPTKGVGALLGLSVIIWQLGKKDVNDDEK